MEGERSFSVILDMLIGAFHLLQQHFFIKWD